MSHLIKFSDIADSLEKYNEIESILRSRLVKVGVSTTRISMILKEMIEEPTYYLYGETIGNIEVIVLMEAFSQVVGPKQIATFKSIKCLVSPTNIKDIDHIKNLYQEIASFPDSLGEFFP